MQTSGHQPLVCVSTNKKETTTMANEIQLADDEQLAAAKRQLAKEYEDNLDKVDADLNARKDALKQKLKTDYELKMKQLEKGRLECQDGKIKTILDALKPVASLMFEPSAEKDWKTLKPLCDQFLFFVNNMFLPSALPGKKMVIEHKEDKTYTIDGKVRQCDQVGFACILMDEAEYENYIRQYMIDTTVSNGCTKKRLASPHDEGKILSAMDNKSLMVSGRRFPLPCMLGAKKQFNLPILRKILAQIIAYLNKYYGGEIPHVDENACLKDVIKTLNKVIDFINGKFPNEDSLRGVALKATSRTYAIYDIIMIILKLLKAYYKVTNK